jgi:hypothetical protein
MRARNDKEHILAIRAAKALVAEERARQAEQRVAQEAKRVADNTAKSATLRALREARDAAGQAG